MTNWVFEFKNEWKQIGGKFNWYSFTPIWIYFENERMTGGVEFWFMILGFGFYLRYNYNFEGSETGKIVAEFEEKMKELEHNENLKLAEYLEEHKDLRVWQNIRNWSGKNYVLTSSHFDGEMFNPEFMTEHKIEVEDTFYN